MKNLLKYLVMAVTLPALAACGVGGGGGDGTALVASKATIKIILTNGTPNTLIAGVDVTLILPDNVTPDAGMANHGVTNSGKPPRCLLTPPRRRPIRANSM